MAPKRARSTAAAVAIANLVAIIEGHCQKVGGLMFGPYLDMATSAKGHVVPSLTLWLPTLMELIKLAPTAVIAWTALKTAFIEIFSTTPRWDPLVREKNHSTISSAEVCARAVRHMLAHLRRMRLQPIRLAQAQAKCADKKESQSLQEMVQLINIEGSKSEEGHDDIVDIDYDSDEPRIVEAGAASSTPAPLPITGPSPPKRVLRQHISIGSTSSADYDVNFDGIDQEMPFGGEHDKGEPNQAEDTSSMASRLEKQASAAPLFQATTKRTLADDKTKRLSISGPSSSGHITDKPEHHEGAKAQESKGLKIGGGLQEEGNKRKVSDGDLPNGWRIVEKFRKSGASSGAKDKYFHSPCGKVLRSMAEVKRFIEAQKEASTK